MPRSEGDAALVEVEQIQGLLAEVDRAQGEEQYARRDTRICRGVGQLAAIDADLACEAALGVMPEHPLIGMNALVEIGVVTNDVAYVDKALIIAKAAPGSGQATKLATIAWRALDVAPERMIEEARGIPKPSIRARTLARIAGRREDIDLLREANDLAEARGLRGTHNNRATNDAIEKSGMKLDYDISIKAHMRIKTHTRTSEQDRAKVKSAFILDCVVPDAFKKKKNPQLLLPYMADIVQAFTWAGDEAFPEGEPWLEERPYHSSDSIIRAAGLIEIAQQPEHKEGLKAAVRKLIERRQHAYERCQRSNRDLDSNDLPLDGEGDFQEIFADPVGSGDDETIDGLAKDLGI